MAVFVLFTCSVTCYQTTEVCVGGGVGGGLLIICIFEEMSFYSMLEIEDVDVE